MSLAKETLMKVASKAPPLPPLPPLPSSAKAEIAKSNRKLKKDIAKAGREYNKKMKASRAKTREINKRIRDIKGSNASTVVPLAILGIGGAGLAAHHIRSKDKKKTAQWQPGTSGSFTPSQMPDIVRSAGKPTTDTVQGPSLKDYGVKIHREAGKPATATVQGPSLKDVGVKIHREAGKPTTATVKGPSLPGIKIYREAGKPTTATVQAPKLPQIPGVKIVREGKK